MDPIENTRSVWAAICSLLLGIFVMFSVLFGYLHELCEHLTDVVGMTML